jgi:hypothetical protein
MLKANPSKSIGVMSLFTDTDEYDANIRKLRTTLMTEWWDSHPDAGPREYPGANRMPDPPVLKVMRWSNARRCPEVPQGVLERFEEGTEERVTWTKLVKAFETKCCTPALPTPGVPAPGGPIIPLPNRPPSNVVGPDLSISPVPADLTDNITVEVLDLADALAVDNVSLGPVLFACCARLSFAIAYWSPCTVCYRGLGIGHIGPIARGLTIRSNSSNTAVTQRIYVAGLGLHRIAIRFGVERYTCLGHVLILLSCYG